MTISRRRLLAAAPLALMAGCAVRGSSTADWVLRGGEVHTANALGQRFSAIALSGQRVLDVGDDDAIGRYIGPATRVVELQGRSVLPGINDSHLHLLGWARSQPPFSLDLTYPGVSSIADCVQQVGEAAQQKPHGEWIVGRGWDSAYHAENRAPMARDLDAVAPHHPVALTDFSGHAMWVNSIALEAADINRNTVPPAGGVIVKDAEGEPTGLLFEGAAWRVRQVMPEPTRDDTRRALQFGAQKMLERGVTSCTIPGQEPAILEQMLEAAADPVRLRTTLLLRAPDSLAGLEAVFEQTAKLPEADPAWAHSEVQLQKDPDRTYEYQYAGPAVQAIIGLEFRVPRMSYFLEYKFTLASYEMPLTHQDGTILFVDLWRQFMRWWQDEDPPGGVLATRLTSHQVIGGLGVRFGGNAPLAAP